MAEQSLFWTAPSTGDGASTYTEDQLRTLFKASMMTDVTSEGVIETRSGYLNKLQPSQGSGIITVASGAAWVNGQFYHNDALITLTIPTPTSGTTGGRIVLRIDYAARTIRVVRNSNSDGNSAIPGLTQNSSTWEISLATFTVTTSGAIAMTDTRTYVHVAGRVYANQIDNLILKRRGGSSSDWTTSGNNMYDGGKSIKCVGVVDVLISGPPYAEVTVTLPQTYSKKPTVQLTCTSGSTGVAFTPMIVSVTTTQITIRVVASATVSEITQVHWETTGEIA